MTPEPETDMEQRITELEDLVVRPGTYFNPQTEVLVIVDDSTSIGQSVFKVDDVSIDAADPPTDTSAPDTTITKRPKDSVKTPKKRAKLSFEFSSEPGSSFECSLDGASFEPCTSPDVEKIKAKPKAKHHEFAVRAADAAGNVDPTPATDEFSVKRKR